MGEYAKRKADGVEVKIGTCSSMYYMTASQIFDIEEASTDVCSCFDELNFRIWMPEEEQIKVGDFENYKVNLRRSRFNLEPTEEDIALYRAHPGRVTQKVNSSNFIDNFNKTGDTGLEIKLKCFHGYNDSYTGSAEEDNSMTLNNRCLKNDVFCLEQISFKDGQPIFTASCGICGRQFSYSYEEFLKMNFYHYNTFEDHEEFIDLKDYINRKIYELQFGEHAEFYKKHIDFSTILEEIPDAESEEQA